MASSNTLTHSSISSLFERHPSLSLPHHRHPCLNVSLSSKLKLRSLSLSSNSLSFRTFAALNTCNNVSVDETPIEKRYPAFLFLLVDRVIEYNPGVSAVAIKNVTINDNFSLVIFLKDLSCLVFSWLRQWRKLKPVIARDTLVMRMTLVKLQKRFGTDSSE